MKPLFKRLLALSLAACTCAVMSGCTLIKFSKADELKQQETLGLKYESGEVALSIKPLEMLSKEELTLEDSLLASDGAQKAVYSAKLPSFIDDGEASVVYTAINQFYQAEFENFAHDRDTFFQLAAGKAAGVTLESHFTYEVLENPAGYVTVLRCLESKGDELTAGKLYFGEVFSASTGWTVNFNDFFGDNAKDAIKLLKQKLEQWCLDNGQKTAWLNDIADNVLTNEFTASADTIYIPLGRHVCGDVTLIELPFEDFLPLIKK